MATNEVFNRGIKKGNLGEVAVTNYFKNKNWTIEDVTKIKQFQDKDIDLVISKDDQYKTIEVKTDYRAKDTGNMFIELMSNVKYGNKGWYYKTQAQFLFYCVAGSGKAINCGCYIFKMSDIRQYVKDKMPRQISYYDNNDKKYVRGALLNINDLTFDLPHQVIDLPELM